MALIFKGRLEQGSFSEKDGSPFQLRTRKVRSFGGWGGLIKDVVGEMVLSNLWYRSELGGYTRLFKAKWLTLKVVWEKQPVCVL